MKRRLLMLPVRVAPPVLAGFMLALLAQPAAAQVSKFNTVNLLTTFIRGVDVAHDNVGEALVVSGVNAIYAQCVGSDGAAGPTITVKPLGVNNVPFGSFPRARFGNSSYLVAWPEEEAGGGSR